MKDRLKPISYDLLQEKADEWRSIISCAPILNRDNYDLGKINFDQDIYLDQWSGRIHFYHNDFKKRNGYSPDKLLIGILVGEISEDGFVKVNYPHIKDQQDVITARTVFKIPLKDVKMLWNFCSELVGLSDNYSLVLSQDGDMTRFRMYDKNQSS